MRRVQFGPVFSDAWARFWGAAGTLVLAGLISLGFAIGIGIVCGILRFVVHGVAGLYLQDVLSFFVYVPLEVGICILCLSILRGRRADAGDIFKGFAKAGQACLAMLVPTILAILALSLLMPPQFRQLMAHHGAPADSAAVRQALLHGMARMVAIGGLLGLVIGPFLLLLLPAVADGAGGFDALALSVREGAANWPQLFLLELVVMLICIPAALLTCGLGSILFLPWSLMVYTRAYTAIRGETSAKTAPPAPYVPAPPPAPYAPAPPPPAPAPLAPAPEPPAPKPEDIERPPAPEDEPPPAPPS